MKKKFTKKPVLAATSDRSEGYNELADVLDDNFDFAMSGFDKLARDSKDGEKAAMQIMLELNNAIESCIESIANSITQ